ncbi:biotin synthase [Arthrobacter sp. Hiyo4]|nr:biotin synthase [Arthrobacter sp. Hiyo4]
MTMQPDLQANPGTILETARTQVLEQGMGLSESQLVEILRLPDRDLPAVLQLAHEVRLRHCGEDVEVEGIISIKTGGCPEDCHFCSQSGLFDSPVRGVWLDIPELVKAAKETAATGATEFCIVAAVRGPDIKLMNQIKFAIDRINEAVDINIACSLGMLTQRQVDQLAEWACTATTTTSRPRAATSRRSSPPTATKSAWTPATWSRTPAWNCAAVP